jgi:predicted HicB family RNase H-like nuclease
MEYKGYLGSVHYSIEDEVFHGKIEFIRSLFIYEGKDKVELEKNFHETVEEYLKTCTKEDKRYGI